MKMLLTALGLLAALSLGTMPVLAESTEISRNGSRDLFLGPDKYFTGSAIVDRLFEANEQTSTTGAMVTFAPGARSAWHTHPAGQTLVVTAGTGWVQEEGGKKHEIKAGDVIWTPPGVKHWHGATGTTSMSHLALTNVKDGKNVDWLEKVSDEQYRAESE